ncbi:peptidoglycan recognition protein family protein [Paenibacillus spongiae]|uniref:N-acetylmuramoyl-L-alanine amidase n=1 Tax=Paenibacillus spongiae TaxID=2909671 RepID=A0ABY5SBB8_9BACL|nr:peptidoglycan recognition family protein [Paenibacillus spongiae]UVI31226.1 N-acetylmuramoyl-L-alanine amidase [Paenibacillus spongiae]
MSFTDIKRIVVHHMASEAPLRNQALYHVNSHHWPGIAYKLCVSDGVLYQTNDLLSYTTHAKGANTDSIGIAVKADLSKRPMTETERQLLYAGILTLLEIWPNAAIVGHNEVSATSCPCTDMKVIRSDIELLKKKIAEQEDYAGSVSAECVRCYAIKERVNELGSRLKDPKWGEAAEMKLEWLYPVIDVVGGDKTPLGVVNRVLEIYKTAMGSGVYSSEGVRKLLLFEPLMNERGLL